MKASHTCSVRRLGWTDHICGNGTPFGDAERQLLYTAAQPVADSLNQAQATEKGRKMERRAPALQHHAAPHLDEPTLDEMMRRDLDHAELLVDVVVCAEVRLRPPGGLLFTGTNRKVMVVAGVAGWEERISLRNKMNKEKIHTVAV